MRNGLNEAQTGIKISRRNINNLRCVDDTTMAEVKVKFTQLCPTLCNPMDYTVHGILQARLLEWVAFPFSRGSSQPRNQTQVSHIAGGFLTNSYEGNLELTLICTKLTLYQVGDLPELVFLKNAKEYLESDLQNVHSLNMMAK